MKKNIILLIFVLQASYSFAQNKLSVYEDSLKNLGIVIARDSVEENRIQANYKFIKTLVEALKEKNSFYYSFKNLSDFVAIKKADDNKFRIITWFTQSDDGSYRYFGAIQVNNPNQLELYPLLDNTQSLTKLTGLEDATLETKKWLGAVYYQIIPVAGIKDPYFILLGWKGKNSLSSSKVIETLKFIDGKPIFGSAVLESKPKSKQFVNRMTFDYVKNASMLLRYVKDENMIVFDHLVAPDKKSEGMTEFYAPDLSYDGLKFKQGKWIFQDNLKLTNLPDEADEFFIDPSKDKQNTAPALNN
ncbi:hypothetical protein [Pedobacter arcticus]|uniref:hypothetical protein n=1 Tax=Pedobacter arcticus TaxID=752140 RepID=UPI00030158F4|nr:hypothetical protein [Pedobacter arcticus]